MSRAGCLRTFVAVCRAGPVTAGGRARGLSQPGLDGGRVQRRGRPVRVGATEQFEAQLLPALAVASMPLVATFDDDARLIDLLVTEELARREQGRWQR